MMNRKINFCRRWRIRSKFVSSGLVNRRGRAVQVFSSRVIVSSGVRQCLSCLNMFQARDKNLDVMVAPRDRPHRLNTNSLPPDLPGTISLSSSTGYCVPGHAVMPACVPGRGFYKYFLASEKSTNQGSSKSSNGRSATLVRTAESRHLSHT